MKKITILLGCFFCLQYGFSQQASYVDPAAAYLRLLLEKGQEATVQQIGAFKVRGTSYLFGEKLSGNAYQGAEMALNVPVSYNTYNQQVEIYQDNQVKPIVLTPAELDSFKLLSSDKTSFTEDLFFVSSKKVDSNAKKFFLQEISAGKRFSLYKAYKSELAFASDNYIQADLREFTLVYDYYYNDVTKPGLKKLKVNATNMKKEFKDVADISIFANSDEFVINPEKALKKIFAQLNL